MLTYEEMQYFLAFSECGTLTQVAEEFNISQPTITRAMKKAEAQFEVPLFSRTKNSIELNDNGRLAAEEIRLLLRQTDEMLERVRAFDRSRRTISLGSAAAVQLPALVSALSSIFPDKSISSELKLPQELLTGLKKNTYQLVILPKDPAEAAPDRYYSRKIGSEHLMFYLPKNHRYARRKSLSLSEMNGENMLLYSDIGFWAEIVRQKMPDSRFLVQDERYSFRELIRNSILPCFTTDLAFDARLTEDRRAVPISDPEVNVTYYLVCRKGDRRRYRNLFDEVAAQLSQEGTEK